MPKVPYMVLIREKQLFVYDGSINAQNITENFLANQNYTNSLISTNLVSTIVANERAYFERKTQQEREKQAQT